MASNDARDSVTTDSKTGGEHEEVADRNVSVDADSSSAEGSGHSAGAVPGAAAVVSAGLGLSSVTGNSLSDMLRAREEIAGQIEVGIGGGGDQIEAFFGAPWDMAAVVNGLFGLIAVFVGGVLLAAHARRADSRTWVKALALGGVALGAIGLLVAGGTYFDLFGAPPELPSPPMPPTG